MIRHIGPYSVEQLTQLLERGYLVHAEQRITRETSPGAPHPHYRFWDNWVERAYYAEAPSIPSLIVLVTALHIHLETWSWYPENHVGTQSCESIQQIIQIQGHDLLFGYNRDHTVNIEITWRDDKVEITVTSYHGRILETQKYDSVQHLSNNEPWDLSRFRIVERPTYQPDYD